MFNDKHYFEVNREERFFCFLFAHALLSSEAVRKNFAHLIKSKYNIGLNTTDLEIYVEAATLRDYWYDLGDREIYDAETHRKRKEVIEAVLHEFGLAKNTIDNYDLFWTSQQRKKLWCPSEWNVTKLKTAGLENLVHVRWAFNAKPDIMLVSGSTVLLIEAKLESGEGRNESGYQQYEIQKLISRLLYLLVPRFGEEMPHNFLLELQPNNGISWKEILDLAEQSELDEYSKKCLLQLKRYYRNSMR